MRLGRGLVIAGVLCAGGCAQLFGLGDTKAAPDAAIVTPKTVRVSGTVYSRAAPGGVSGVSITWMGMTGAMTITDSTGAYSLVLTSFGATIDGYVQAQLNGYLETELYPAAPLASDATGLDLPVVTQSELDAGAQLVGVTQAPDQCFLGLKVLGSGGAVAGAIVTTTPVGSVYYDQGGMPSPTATATDASGLAYAFNVPPGAVTVDAMLTTGIKFAAHAVICRAGTITATVIAEAQ